MGRRSAGGDTVARVPVLFGRETTGQLETVTEGGIGAALPEAV